MNLHIEILDWQDISKYQENFPDYTYSQEFVNFQKTRTNCQRVFVGIYEDQELLGILPLDVADGKTAYSVYKDYTHPFLISTKEIEWQKVAGLIRKLLKINYLRLYLAGLKNFTSQMSNFVLSLDQVTTAEDILLVYNRKTRNEVRKARNNNFQSQMGGLEKLSEFYELYQENMKRHGTWARSITFFENLFKCFSTKCALIMVYDSQTLAGANLIIFNNQYLRLAFNVSKVEYWPKCINDFLYDRTIIYGWQKQIKTFDFGPSLTTDLSHNKFKLGFGARQGYLQEYICGKMSYRLSSWWQQKVYSFKLKLNKHE